MRRFRAAGLAVAVVAATVGGTVLVQAFDSGDDNDRLGRISPTPGPVANGRIAYTHDRGGLWTINDDGSLAENIADGGYMPAWSPDGTKIAFIRAVDIDPQVASNPAIYVSDANGANATHLKDLEESNHALAWAPDGTRIAYMNRGNLFVMNVDGSNSRRIVTSSPRDLNFHPTWSSDGSRIAFARFTFDEPLSNEPGVGDSPSGSGIYVVAPDGGGLTRLTEGPSADVGLDEWPDWSPDGRKIVFQRAFDIYVINVDGSDLRKLTTGGVSLEPSWSPDQRKIVHQRANWPVGLFELFVMNADGSALTRLPILRATDFTPDWQPIPVEVAPSPSPRTSPSPTSSPSPASCDASQVTGNFNGDGAADSAAVAKTKCLIEVPDPKGYYGTEYALHVRWPPFEGIVPLYDCRTVCQAIAAADLNGDGIDEFILKVNVGAATQHFQIYELPTSESFGRPSDVAGPGAPGFPAGEPARFTLGGSVTRYAALGCNLLNRQVIVQVAELNPDQTRYNVHEILLRFDPIDPIDAPPDGRFTVVSERNFTEHYEEGISPSDQFEPGDPCWIDRG